MTWRLAGFDLDGTLVYGDTVLLHVSRHLGKYQIVRELVAGYESFRLTNFEVAHNAAQIFEGLRKGDLFGLMEDIPRLHDIGQCIEYMHDRNIRCAVATVTFDFASEWFATRYGFDSYNGIELAVDDRGRYTGEVLRHVNEDDKATFIRQLAMDAGTSLDDVIYVGDSRSDLPTFSIVGFSVALNATANAAAAASTSIETVSLKDVLGLVPGLSD